MINETMLAFIIASFCQFSNPQISRENKELCGEYMTNCIVQKDGKTSNKIVNYCKEAWAEKEVKERTQK